MEYREFWEWCGFKNMRGKQYGGVKVSYGYLHPDGVTLVALPELDLNNLFKYAVPALLQGKSRKEKNSVYLALCSAMRKITDTQDNPADIVFEAVYKALGGKE